MGEGSEPDARRQSRKQQIGTSHLGGGARREMFGQGEEEKRRRGTVAVWPSYVIWWEGKTVKNIQTNQRSLIAFIIR